MSYTPPVGPDGKPIQDDDFVAKQQAKAAADLAAEARRQAGLPKPSSGRAHNVGRLFDTKDEALAYLSEAWADGKFPQVVAEDGSGDYVIEDGGGWYVVVLDDDPNPPLEVVLGNPE